MGEANITEIKTLNGYPLADTKAREDIAQLSEEIAEFTFPEIEGYSKSLEETLVNVKPTAEKTEGVMWNYRGIEETSSVWSYYRLNVSEGETYRVSTYVQGNARAVCVYDIDGERMSYFPETTPSGEVVSCDIVIPSGAAYIICNERKNIAALALFKIVSAGKAVYKYMGLPDNSLWGKTLVCVGDSITYGEDMDEEGIAVTPEIRMYQANAHGEWNEVTGNARMTYGYQIATRNGMIFYNGGDSGSTMQGLSERAGFSLANGRYTKLPEDMDYLTIWFGWNDTAVGTLGTIDDTTNESFFGGYNVVLPYLLNKHPDTKIALIVPFGCDAAHREAVRTLAGKWGVACWDNYQSGTPLYFGKEDSVGVDTSIVQANKAKFQANGAHPNYKGHKQLADMLEHFLRGI